jgi:cyclic pyranopterin phosphate synthase
VVELAIEEDGVVIEAQVRTKDRTGVELEALTACLVAALSLFEAVKGEDPAARIEEATVLEKAGGASGTWRRREDGTLEHVPRGDDLGQEGRARRT